MTGIINWRKCKKCGEPFDIDISKDLCPSCRRKSRNEIRNLIKKGQTRLK